MDRVKIPHKIKSLQGLRALAFLGVFASHCDIAELGAWGVSVFFVMSGFLMSYSYFDREVPSGVRESLSFSLKKIRKLYPLHIIMMLAVLPFEVLPIIKDFTFRGLSILLCKIGLNIGLLQDWVPHSSYYFSLNSVSWYLSACLFIYAVFPSVLRRLRQMRIYMRNIRAATGSWLFICTSEGVSGSRR